MVGFIVFGCALYVSWVLLAGWTTLECMAWLARNQRVSDEIQAEGKRQLAIRSVERT